MTSGKKRFNDWLIGLVLPWLALLATSLPSNAMAQFREEVATLESLYESRARAVLNSILRPQDYSIVISATIENDREKLDKYQEELELGFMPGLPGLPAPDLLPANNTLHSLKSRISVNLVLAETVPVEKEKIIASILKSKLHLDEEAGDTLTIERTMFDTEKVDPKPPQLLPDFTWKTWALILILALLALAGIIFWATRRAQAAPIQPPYPELSEMLSKSNEANGHQDSTEDEDEDEAPESESGAAYPAKLQEQIVTTEKMKDLILSVAARYPQITSKAIVEYFEAGNEHDVVLLFEKIEWDVARKVFAEIPVRMWGRIGHIIRERITTPPVEAYNTAIANCYRVILSRFLESGAEQDAENPFGFIFKLPSAERRRLLAGEDPTSLALICLFAPSGEVNEIFDAIDTNLQSEVAVAIARVEQLPESVVRSTANQLRSKLLALQMNPEMSIEGPRKAANLIRALSPETEEEIFNRLLMEHPEEARSIQRQSFRFQDSCIVPTPILSEALEGVEIADLVIALYDTSDELKRTILSSIPAKKARIVERDLAEGILTGTPAKRAEVRRVLGATIERAIVTRGLKLSKLWEDYEAQLNGRPNEDTAA